MNTDKLQGFLDVLGLDEQPMGMAYERKCPEGGNAPRECDMPSLEDEQAGTADFRGVFENFSCVFKHIWILRRKGDPAWFNPGRCGCMGAAQYLGFRKGPFRFVAHYVSTGMPHVEGECYTDSPESFDVLYAAMDPQPAPAPYCVFRRLSDYPSGTRPELVTFFARPEVMSGLHQYITFLTCDAESVASPWGSGCSTLVTWPLLYRRRGQTRAVLGGWDPSMRKLLKTDELFLTVPLHLYEQMVERWHESFLGGARWQAQRKKIERSKKVWGEV
ncbi:MAG: DUF169 domain-containing protein [Desulfovibrionaceae bacterium]